MDVLKEFLESSTIHGLTYVSTAKVTRQTLNSSCLNSSSLISSYLNKFWVLNLLCLEFGRNLLELFFKDKDAKQ